MPTVISITPIEYGLVLALVLLLVLKELISTQSSPRARRINRLLTVLILPLLAGFGLMIITRLIAVLH